MQFNRPFATVTPTLDGDVLAVLAGHDGTFTTGQIRRVVASVLIHKRAGLCSAARPRC